MGKERDIKENGEANRTVLLETETQLVRGKEQYIVQEKFGLIFFLVAQVKMKFLKRH